MAIVSHRMDGSISFPPNAPRETVIVLGRTKRRGSIAHPNDAMPDRGDWSLSPVGGGSWQH